MGRSLLPKNWEQTFLEAFRNSGNVRAACQAAGVRRQLVYERRAKNKTFAAKWDEAREDAIDTLEATAWTRARATSDYLLWKLLQSNRRSLYGDKQQVEHSGTVTLADIAKAASGHTD
jgi:hypothetical protein